ITAFVILTCRRLTCFSTLCHSMLFQMSFSCMLVSFSLGDSTGRLLLVISLLWELIHLCSFQADGFPISLSVSSSSVIEGLTFIVLPPFLRFDTMKQVCIFSDEGKFRTHI